MRSVRRSHPLLAIICLGLLIAIASVAARERSDATSAQTVVSGENTPLPLEPSLRAGGRWSHPPSCLGFSLGDPCVTRRALGQCRAAVARCKGEPILVIQTCPLQFRCGR